MSLSRYGSGWLVVFDKAQPKSFQKLADRHVDWFMEHPGWDAPKMLVDELQDFMVDDEEEEKDEPALD